MKSLTLLLAVIIVTWDVVTYGPEKKVHVFDEYTGVSYSYTTRVMDKKRPMVKEFKTKEEARTFLNRASDPSLPIFGQDLKYQRPRSFYFSTLTPIGEKYRLDNFVVKDENTVYYDGRQKR